MAVGRPRKYKTVKELENAINKYFLDCEEKEVPYTVTGLAMACGFEDRGSLLEYCNYKDESGEEFSHSIKKAKSFVEQSIERGLLSGKYNATGAIFNLKNNYGWKDKTEVENTGEQSLNVNIKVMDNGS